MAGRTFLFAKDVSRHSFLFLINHTDKHSFLVHFGHYQLKLIYTDKPPSTPTRPHTHTQTNKHTWEMKSQFFNDIVISNASIPFWTIHNCVLMCIESIDWSRNFNIQVLYLLLLHFPGANELMAIIMVQWNLFITTTSEIKFITCGLFRNVF